MRILYVAPKYDYGKPEQGFSFEHYNFYDFFFQSGHEIVYFDFLTEQAKLGKPAMNRRLLEMASSEKPDLMFMVLFTDEFDPAVIRQISGQQGVVTMNWFCDDHWRFENYSSHWAPCFNWVVTTARSAVPKYTRMKYSNVIKSQWGCNHLLYRRLDLPLVYDVSFVGQPHGNRRRIIHELEANGIRVHTFGAGWGSGRVSQEDMIRVFNQSRINLNLSNASVTVDRVSIPAVQSGLDWLARTLDKVPAGGAIKAMGRRIITNPTAHGREQGEGRQAAPSPKYFEQIKARNFEVPGCGGFLLTGKAEDLESYYTPEKEIACFDDTSDLIDKIRYYLSHEGERARIAEAGYARTIREHTYAHRFEEIFKRLRLA